ncbi:MAG: cell division protein FtsI (penicillin-binding protein 3) [Parcubacteria group bacterium Gr01-1014_48]|nr:MAG: cell division protein FtsI (penicillin-binding protein 3) [Parcubacteria group bacterium Greene0416_14]TSC73717.1 MAG: cell division protein FtsI (penicillin-binding protein 3) [Parcubacteria group bacterium Gr01-1014_48]TSD01001.1 MAG: cell division protein FtsI (penicillin-binding protein 3) [Parcubacteria group bacterium Greene1014_15]TSD08104.1 MAG: cell division protein FtsI (penicillin-binding protein 3) [Parcubacteria group bacterium Greene0714_4]
MNRRAIFRIRILFAGIFLFALLIVSKLYLVQIVNGDILSERAERQYMNPSYVTYNRGAVFFEDKDGKPVSAATLKTGFIVYLNPVHIEDAPAVYEQLAQHIEIDKEAFLTKAGKKDDPYEEIAVHVDSETANKIEALKIPGIHLQKQKWRFYPGGSMMSHALGFVGWEGDDLSGRYGIERYYDDVLNRSDEGVYVNFFAEIFSNLSKVLAKNKKRSEGDIVLSIEPSVQSFLEKQLEEVTMEWHARAAGGIIINPQNGEMYAIAAYPAYDLNAFGEEKNSSIFANPLVENVFEMGSIIKPLTMAAGLDVGAVTAETTYYDAGFVEMNSARIENFDGKGRGKVDMQKVLNDSLNTGAVFIEQKIGNAKFSQYFRDYGLGEETGIDVPNETMGLLDNLDSPRDIEHATAAFGQGIAMTPIGTVRALSALANGGKRITPHLAKRIEYKLGYSKSIAFPPDKQVLEPETSEEITRMLVRVVDEALLEGKVKMDQYSIAAKTGTAQIAKEGGGGYYDDRYLHSFFGYFPAYKPKFLVFLYVIEPKGVRYASATLTHPFIDIAKFLLNYYQVPPDRGAVVP